MSSSAMCDGEAVSVRLSPGNTYTVTVKYSQELMFYGADEVTVSIMEDSYVDSERITVSDVSWSGSEVTFTFNTIQTNHSAYTYYFEIEGLVGQESKLAPNPASFTVVNNPVFSCPYVEGSFNTVYATTPALIADSDLSTEGWTYADGTSVSETTPHKFTLVVSSPTAEDVESMEGALTEAGESGTIAATYEITLGLCDKQISYINGERVKVLIPFPEGYSYETLGDTTFKAYHFNSDGEAEVIECVVTESGIIIYCEAFSPFAIVATTEPQTERKAAVLSFGNGSVETDLIKVSKGDSVTIEINADEGYVIDSIVLNGVQIDSYNATEGTLEVEYSQLETVGNYIEITFVAESVAVVEADHGFHIVVTDEAEGSSGLATWELVVIIIACVVVVIGVAVVVLLLTKNRKKHMPEDGGPGESGDVTV